MLYTLSQRFKNKAACKKAIKEGLLVKVKEPGVNKAAGMIAQQGGEGDLLWIAWGRIENSQVKEIW